MPRAKARKTLAAAAESPDRLIGYARVSTEDQAREGDDRAQMARKR